MWQAMIGGQVPVTEHEEWLSQLTCPILRLDGCGKLENNAKTIIEIYQKMNDGKLADS